MHVLSAPLMEGDLGMAITINRTAQPLFTVIMEFGYEDARSAHDAVSRLMNSGSYEALSDKHKAVIQNILMIFEGYEKFKA